MNETGKYDEVGQFVENYRVAFKDLGIPPEDQEKIFWKNCAAFWGI